MRAYWDEFNKRIEKPVECFVEHIGCRSLGFRRPCRPHQHAASCCSPLRVTQLSLIYEFASAVRSPIDAMSEVSSEALSSPVRRWSPFVCGDSADELLETRGEIP